MCMSIPGYPFSVPLINLSNPYPTDPGLSKLDVIAHGSIDSLRSVAIQFNAAEEGDCIFLWIGAF